MKYIEIIKNALIAARIKHGDSFDEMLDHYSSQYEELQNTNSPDQAMNIVLAKIQSTNLKQFNKQSMIQKHKYLFLTCSILILSIASYNAMQSSVDHVPEESSSYVLAANSEEPMDPPYGSPLKSQDISSGFGKRMHPIKKVLKLHKGIDFKADLGTAVFTVEDGTVINTGFDEKNGNFIEIQHDEIYSTRYHHLGKILVKKDQTITKGTKIGEVGNTGFSTGPHLHYEIIKEGKNVDPEIYLKA